MLDSLIDDWREHCLIQRGQQPRGVMHYETIIRSFFAWMKSKGFEVEPEQVARDHVTTWQRALFMEMGNMSNNTRGTKLYALKSFFGYLKYAGLIDFDPTGEVQAPKVQDKLAQKFSTEELRLIFAAPDRSTPRGVRDLAILKTLYAAGPRVAELAALDLNHIHDSGGYIRLELLRGKGGKSRTVTLRTRASKSLREWLTLRSQYPTDDDAVFIALQGDDYNRLSIRSLQVILKKYSSLVGIPKADAFCHKMRSTFASDLYDSGNDRCPRCRTPIHYVGLLEVQSIMGHQDPKTTQRYIAISDRVLKKTAIPDRRFKEIEEEEDQ